MPDFEIKVKITISESGETAHISNTIPGNLSAGYALQAVESLTQVLDAAITAMLVVKGYDPQIVPAGVLYDMTMESCLDIYNKQQETDEEG